MKYILVGLSDELSQAIDHARGDSPRNPWIEAQLWRLKAVQDGADSAGVSRPERPIDGRGRWRDEDG